MRIVLAAIAALLLSDISAAAQAPNVPAKRPTTAAKAEWTARTPDGQPDLQGTWVNFDSTPFETPVPVSAPGNNPGVGPPEHWANHDSPTSARRP